MVEHLRPLLLNLFMGPLNHQCLQPMLRNLKREITMIGGQPCRQGQATERYRRMSNGDHLLCQSVRQEKATRRMSEITAGSAIDMATESVMAMRARTTWGAAVGVAPDAGDPQKTQHTHVNESVAVVELEATTE